MRKLSTFLEASSASFLTTGVQRLSANQPDSLDIKTGTLREFFSLFHRNHNNVFSEALYSICLKETSSQLSARVLDQLTVLGNTVYTGCAKILGMFDMQWFQGFDLETYTKKT